MSRPCSRESLPHQAIEECTQVWRLVDGPELCQCRTALRLWQGIGREMPKFCLEFRIAERIQAMAFWISDFGGAALARCVGELHAAGEFLWKAIGELGVFFDGHLRH